MTIKNAFPGTKAFRDVKKLYDSAFASGEQLPFSRIAVLSALRPSVHLLAYYDENGFCGFSFGVCTEKYLYVDFFAVSEHLRDRGYGTKMLRALQEKLKKPMIGECRQPEPESPEYDQQLRRVEFWKRNGFDFFDDQYIVRNNGINYIVNCTEHAYDREAYWAIFDHLSFGLGAQLRILKRKLKK